MSEVSAKKSIQRLLENNANDLLQGIVRFDVQRVFQHITRSPLTPPTGYYFVAIFVENKRKRTFSESANDEIDIKIKQYRVNISLVDYIFGVTGETQLYEAMTDDFNLITDRIIELIDPDDTFTYFYDETNRFRLTTGTEVSCDNTPVFWEEAETYHAVLIADITFDIETC